MSNSVGELESFGFEHIITLLTCSVLHVGVHNLNAVSDEETIGVTFKDSWVLQ